jgi:hypothetical protein
VGEVQKAYNALASILKRDADEAYTTVEKLRSRLEDIEYPGKHHPATAEVRAGMLERKSKYLKSYTPGW